MSYFCCLLEFLDNDSQTQSSRQLELREAANAAAIVKTCLLVCIEMANNVSEGEQRWDFMERKWNI